MVTIEINGLEKSFAGTNGVRPVLHGINLVVAKGEVIAIRGDNGCGKTTLLNIICGVESKTGGTITFVSEFDHKLRVGYTQQDYTSSLLPWFNVLDNVAIPLRIQQVGKAERKRKANELLDSLGFRNLPKAAFPHQLSGGQKQRIAVARALIHEPQLLLMDEPFANLDAHSSRDLQETLSLIHDKVRPTIIYVSHELDHCIYLADRVFLLHGSPASIVHTFEIPLPRPRRREVVLSSDFTQIRSKILAAEESLYAKKA